jgi:hypothetical protein
MYDAPFKGFCNSSIRADSGSLFSLNYPNNYNNSMNCFQHVLLPSYTSTRSVSLVFSTLKMERHPTCAYDYIEVFTDRQLTNSQGRFCGSQQNLRFNFQSSEFVIMTRSDASLTQMGFQAFYTLEEVQNPTAFSCDFTTDLCGMTQSSFDQIDWTWRTGTTDSLYTGPTSDHTTGTGYYMYVEATNIVPNAMARLQFPSQIASTNIRCLSFWYHMYGAGMGSLQVESSSSFGTNTLWSMSGNQGNAWRSARVDLPPSSAQFPATVSFLGTRGSSYQSDIAIDDVTVTNGQC